MNIPLKEPEHVFPDDDFFQHEKSGECPCGPTELVIYGRGYDRPALRRSVMHKHVQGLPTPSYVPAGWA